MRPPARKIAGTFDRQIRKAFLAALVVSSTCLALAECGGIYNGEIYAGEWIDNYGHLNSFFVIPANVRFVPLLTFPYGNKILAGHSYIGHFLPPTRPGEKRDYNSGGLLVAIMPEENGKAFRIAGLDYPVYPDDTRGIPTYTLVLQRDLHHFFGSRGSRDILMITTFIPHVAPTETMAKNHIVLITNLTPAEKDDLLPPGLDDEAYRRARNLPAAPWNMTQPPIWP